MKRRVIQLSTVEIHSGLNRQRNAEKLIQQPPKDHDGRNSWLLNYGVSDEAETMRTKRDLQWIKRTQCCEIVAA